MTVSGTMLRARRVRLAALLALLAVAGCAAEPRWRSAEQPIDRDAARLYRSEGAAGAPRDPYADEIAAVPIRKNMRPCCAFGAQLHVRVGAVPVPFIFLGNVTDRRRIRHHAYDSGSQLFGSRSTGAEFGREANGLVYTCRGGFIDVAHVRDYADTALYTITMLARHLEEGGEFPLPDEGARVRIALNPVDPRTLAQYGRWSVAIPLGQWLAYQASLWHEIVTWFGWSTFALFPEKVSSFSPEDLYSNLLGARIGAAVVSQRGSRDEFAYNRNVDRWLDRTLAYMGAVSADVGEEAMRSMNGIWWDSTKRIPDVSLVLRRSFEIEDIKPWLVGPPKPGSLLLGACGPGAKALPIVNPASMSGIDFASQASLVIDLPESLSSQEPFVKLGPRITQKDFPALVEFIRAQNREMFGPLADRPDTPRGMQP